MTTTPAGVLLGVLITLLQCFDGVLFYDIFLKRRTEGLRFWGGYLLIAVSAGLVLNLWAIPLNFGRVLFSMLPFAVLSLCLYSGGVVFRILVSGLFYALLNGLGILVAYGVVQVVRGGLRTPYAAYAVIILASVTEQLLGMGLILLAQKLFHPRKRGQEAWQLWLVPLCLTFGSTGMCVYLLHSAANGRTPVQAVLVCTVYLVFVNLLVMVLIDWLAQSARYREESLMLNEKLHTQAESLEALGNAYAVQRRLTHDYNAHLVSLNGYLKEKDYARAEAYTRDLLSQQTDRLLAVKTHHAALDALFNQKAFVADRQGIDLRFVVSDLSGLQLPVSDLTVLISNLMDNAIEACARLPQAEREIEVRAILEDTFLFSVRNRSLPVHIVHGTIATTKPDPSMHGYGLANVQTILERYRDCCHDMSYKNGWFCHLVELPNRPRS